MVSFMQFSNLKIFYNFSNVYVNFFNEYVNCQEITAGFKPHGEVLKNKARINCLLFYSRDYTKNTESQVTYRACKILKSTLQQGSKGIRQWSIIGCTTSPQIKISGWNVWTLNFMNQPIKIQ